jgi:hypothetical protein
MEDDTIIIGINIMVNIDKVDNIEEVIIIIIGKMHKINKMAFLGGKIVI